MNEKTLFETYERPEMEVILCVNSGMIMQSNQEGIGGGYDD